MTDKTRTREAKQGREGHGEERERKCDRLRREPEPSNQSQDTLVLSVCVCVCVCVCVLPWFLIGLVSLARYGSSSVCRLTGVRQKLLNRDWAARQFSLCWGGETGLIRV